MAATGQHVELHLIGMVRLLDEAGADITPRGARARALLSILALSRDMVRGRRWLEGRLWSTRDPKQAGASLRQTLSEVRRAFGPAADILIADRSGVGLDASRMRVDVFENEAAAQEALTDGAELMEGLEVADAAFRTWRDEQRARFRAELGASSAAATTIAVAPAEAPVQNGTARPKLLVAADHSGNRVEDAIADAIGRQIARTATETARLDLAVPGPQTQLHPAQTLKISPMVVDQNGESMVSLELARPSDGNLLWSEALNVRKSGPQVLTDADLIAAANQAAEEISKHAAELSQNGIDSASQRSSAMLQAGVAEMFSMDGARMHLAEQFFREAEDERDAAMASAWRSLLAMILFAESGEKDRREVQEKVRHHLTRALEVKTDHPTILGVVSQIISFMSIPGYNAMELAQKAVKMNQWNPMAKLALGMAHLRKGDVRNGYLITGQARDYASRLQNRHWWDMSFCLAALSAGKIDEAIEAAETSLTFHPNFRPPMRHLYVLYLHKERFADAEEMLRRMRALEPDFSLRRMREDPSYPVNTIRRTSLISQSDMDG